LLESFHFVPDLLSFAGAMNLGFEPRAVAGEVSSPATAGAVDAE